MIKITLQDYAYTCGDGCCDYYGTYTTVNGKKLDCENSDTLTILQNIFEELKIDAEIEELEGDY